MLTVRKVPFPPDLHPGVAERARESFFGRVLSRLSGDPSPSKALAHDLAHGIEELVVEPDAVAVHRVEDGGPFVFLDVGALTVMLAGDWLLDINIDAGRMLQPKVSWPRSVRLLRAPTGGQVLKFEVLDAAPLPTRIVSPVLSDFRESCVLLGGLAELQGTVTVREAEAIGA